MTAHFDRLCTIEDTRLRLQLMLVWEDLCAAGIIRRALPPAAWDDLVRRASADERPGVVTAILAAQQEDSRFPARVDDALVALAIYEATPAQLGTLQLLAPWTPVVTRALSDRSREDRPEIPHPVLAHRSWRRRLPEARPAETTPSLVLAEPDPDVAARLVDGYQSLWAWDVLDAPMDAELVERTVEHLLAEGDVDGAARLLELVPGDDLEDTVMDRRTSRFDLSTRPTHPRITGSYAAVPAAARWRAPDGARVSV